MRHTCRTSYIYSILPLQKLIKNCLSVDSAHFDKRVNTLLLQVPLGINYYGQVTKRTDGTIHIYFDNFNKPNKSFSFFHSDYDGVDIFVPVKSTLRSQLLASHKLNSKCALEVTEEQHKVIDQIYKEKNEIDSRSGVTSQKITHVCRVSHIYYNAELKSLLEDTTSANFSKIEALLCQRPIGVNYYYGESSVTKQIHVQGYNQAHSYLAFVRPLFNYISNQKEDRNIFVPTEKTIRAHIYDMANLGAECAMELTEEQHKIINDLMKENQFNNEEIKSEKCELISHSLIR